MSKKGSLTVVGCGIKFYSHLTTETKAHIKQSDYVLYLVNDPAMKLWIQSVNSNTQCLDDIYNQYNSRAQCYQAITTFILETLRKNIHLCVVMYGHPTLFAEPALNAAIQAKIEGYSTKILPGISAENCLFADLLINPGSCGYQSFDATDLLIYKRQINPTSHLILWQIGCIGAAGHLKSHDNFNGIINILKYLNTYYSLHHEVTLYEAAQYPHLEPKIEKFSLEFLADQQCSTLSTLYLPPAASATYDVDMIAALKI